ncbi:hypothetical protein H4582DRAFT_2129731 [Lactarius indigo]|nr:hypothetical protein H4582DRAFT_2129731 [Lactarius indigo]
MMALELVTETAAPVMSCILFYFPLQAAHKSGNTASGLAPAARHTTTQAAAKEVLSGGLLGHFQPPSYQVNAFHGSPKTSEARVTASSSAQDRDGLLRVPQVVQRTSFSASRIANAVLLLIDCLPPNGKSLLELRFPASTPMISCLARTRDGTLTDHQLWLY